jgi:serine protease
LKIKMERNLKRCIALLVSVSLLMVVCGAALGSVAGSGTGGAVKVNRGSDYIPDEVLVKFKGEAGAAGAHANSAVGRFLREGAGALSARHLEYTDLEVVKVARGGVQKAIKALSSSPLVEYAVPNYRRHADFSPDDPYYQDGHQWNLRRTPGNGGINMPAAWDAVSATYPYNGGSPSVVVAILDTGVAYENRGMYHKAPDLASTTFIQGYDFVNEDAYADDDHGHGTHICGTIAQQTNNTYVCAGIAFNCKVMPVKVLDQQGSGSDTDVIQGIRYAADRGVEVINLSLGGPDPSPALEEAVNYAFGKGVVICAASGNASSPEVEYPAAYESCIAVGATNISKSLTSYSNYGSAQDVVAPGGDGSNPIWQVTYSMLGHPTSPFAVVGMSGTSMATPHVAGTAALVRSQHPSWSASGVRGAITSTCYNLGVSGWDPTFGWGLIDARAAVALTSEPSLAAPEVRTVSPDFAASGSKARVAIGGSNFTSQMKVVMERDGETSIRATNMTGSSGRITCDFNLSSAQPGLWDLVVENSQLKSTTVQGAFMVDSADGRVWYLAEGSTDHGFEEFILIQNPGAEAAAVDIEFMTPAGIQPTYQMNVPAMSRVTLRVNDVLPGTDVSAKLTADHDIICERSMYWNNRIEGTDCIGVQAPSHAWYLAEGSTDYGFDTFLLVQNPNGQQANVSVTYLTPGGRVQKPQFPVGPYSRYTINVRDVIPNDDMSFEVVSDQRVIAERSMYWDGMRGGHDSIGTNSPTREWYLGEGSTDWGFDEWVLLGNPGSVSAKVELTYMTPNGPVPQAPVTVPAGSRVTVHVNAALPGRDVSVKAEADRGIVVERAMYWNDGTGKAGHCAIAVPQPRQQCYMAEGSTDWGFDEWVLIQNPNDTACNISVEYMTPTGLVPRQGFSMAANSRVTIHVNADLPMRDVSTRVFSDKRIIAERSMYWNGRGGGHVSQALLK